MESFKYLLEHYQRINPKGFMDLVQLLNDERRWELVLMKLKSYRNPINLSERAMRMMNSSNSPSQVLLTELIARHCTVGHLLEILEDLYLFGPYSILAGIEKLEIRIQPGEDDKTQLLNDGDELKLYCYAVGRPLPEYQWYRDNVPLKGFTKPELLVNPFREDDEGNYYCDVSHMKNNILVSETSNNIICRLIEVLPQFIQQLPEELTVCPGSDVELAVQVSQPSRCKIKWLQGNNVLNETSNILKLTDVKKEDEGKYRCLANNSAGEVFSEVCNLQVFDDTENRASAKVALLIANERYSDHSRLNTPCNDAVTLAKILQKLGFRVITLINLNFTEMDSTVKWFFQMIPQKACVFFYYVGHGFEIFNNKFMMPVDCPKTREFRMMNCICDQLVLKLAMNNKVKVVVILLDMCLKLPERQENPGIYKEIAPVYDYTRYSKCNIIQAFATSSHQSAYEKATNYNGLYMEHLKKYLMEDFPLASIFQQAHADFTSPETDGKQNPVLYLDCCQKFKLTDLSNVDVALDAQIEVINQIDRHHELCFPSLGIKTPVTAESHRGVVLNAIDLNFSDSLSKWLITADVTPGILNQWEVNTNSDGVITLTLYDIQKAKSDIFITIKLIEPLSPEERSDDESPTLAGFCPLDLKTPLVAHINLWFQRDSPNT